MTGKVGHCYVMLNNGVSFTVSLNLLHFFEVILHILLYLFSARCWENKMCNWISS